MTAWLLRLLSVNLSHSFEHDIREETHGTYLNRLIRATRDEPSACLVISRTKYTRFSFQGAGLWNIFQCLEGCPAGVVPECQGAIITYPMSIIMNKNNTLFVG